MKNSIQEGYVIEPPEQIHLKSVQESDTENSVEGSLQEEGGESQAEMLGVVDRMTRDVTLGNEHALTDLEGSLKVKDGMATRAESGVDSLLQKNTAEFLRLAHETTQKILAGIRDNDLSSAANYVPVVGSAKMAVEGVAGKTADGEDLQGAERVKHGLTGAGMLVADLTAVGEIGRVGKAGLAAFEAGEHIVGAHLADEAAMHGSTVLKRGLERGALNDAHEVSPKEETEEKVTPHSRAESYQFSKEYSRASRNRLAEELKTLRKKYRVDIPQEQQKRNAELDLHRKETHELEEEIVSKERELAERRQELLKEVEERRVEVEALMRAIEAEKGKLWNRTKEFFGMKNHLISVQEGILEAQRSALNELSDKNTNSLSFLQDRTRARVEHNASVIKGRMPIETLLAQKCAEVVLDDTESEATKKRLQDFYGKQLEIKTDWEESQDERGVAEQAKRSNALFLHGIPFGSSMNNTSENNSVVNTESMTGEQKTQFLFGLEPTISVSAKALSKEDIANKGGREMMYPTGLILSEGQVMSAFERDAATFAESIDVKYAKYDKTEQSAIQPNVSERVAAAVSARSGKNTMTPWNELVVRKPKFAAAYVQKSIYDKSEIINILKTAEEYGLPVVMVGDEGELSDLSTNEILSREQIMAGSLRLTAQERMKCVENNIGNLKPTQSSVEDARKADALRARAAKLDQASPSNEGLDDKALALNRKNVGETLFALEAERVASWIQDEYKQNPSITREEFITISQDFEGDVAEQMQKILAMEGDIGEIAERLLEKSKQITSQFQFSETTT